MFDRLAQIEARWKELNDALAAPEIANDSANYQKTAKAQGELAPIVEKYHEYQKLQSGIADSRVMIAGETDPDMLAYAQEELHSARTAACHGRGRAEGSAPAQRSQRREERGAGNPRRYRRR